MPSTKLPKQRNKSPKSYKLLHRPRNSSNPLESIRRLRLDEKIKETDRTREGFRLQFSSVFLRILVTSQIIFEFYLKFAMLKTNDFNESVKIEILTRIMKTIEIFIFEIVIFLSLLTQVLETHEVQERFHDFGISYETGSQRKQTVKY